MAEEQTLNDFYRLKFDHTPENLDQAVGHFNVFHLKEFTGKKGKPMPYSRRNYYKISLMNGKSKVHYADKTVMMNGPVILFATPHIPYTWEDNHEEFTGNFCVFTPSFFDHFIDLKRYPVFQPDGTPIFTLTHEEYDRFEAIFRRMFDEIDSEYQYKEDVLRNLTHDLVLSALKLKPALPVHLQHSNAAEHIHELFMELLDRQFPIQSTAQSITCKTPSEFANQLNVHVNHLNRALKTTTQKTTSMIIAERWVREAKILLKETNWNIAEIAQCLGFEETAHFSNYFKKQSQHSPASYRKAFAV